MKKSLIVLMLLGLVVATSPVIARGNEDKDLRKLEKSFERLERFELPTVESRRSHASSLFIGPQGQVRIISGEIISLSGTTTPNVDGVKVWGLELEVDMAGTRFIPEGTTHADLNVGDKVNIHGRMDRDTGVINATLVHALSSRSRAIDDLFQKILDLIEKIRELQEKAGLPLTPLPTSPDEPIPTEPDTEEEEEA